MAKKARTSIPKEVADKALFDSDGICCVCRDLDRYVPVQIHHIDENPSNNKETNLAVLCFDCHNRTQLHGGFGRHLNATQVSTYRKDWLIRVLQSRGENVSKALIESALRKMQPDKDSDELMSAFEEMKHRQKEIDHENFCTLLSERTTKGELSRILTNLPTRHREAYKNSQLEWDSGVTSRMTQGNYNLTNSIVVMMKELVPFFSNGPLAIDGAKYIENRIEEAYIWNRACEDTVWNQSRGTIKNILISGRVTGFVEDMLKSMVGCLGENLIGFDFRGWERDWNRGGNG